MGVGVGCGVWGGWEGGVTCAHCADLEDSSAKEIGGEIGTMFCAPQS